MNAMRQKIRSWLNKPTDYIVGVNLLYDATGMIGTRDSLLKHKSMDKLILYLEKYIDDLDAHEQKIIIEETSKPIEVVEKNHSLVIDNTLESLHNKYVLLLKEISITHSKLLEAETDAIRFEIAKECITLDAKSLKVYEEILYYKKHGKLPTKAPLPKNKDCDESMAEKKLKLKSMSALLWTDRRRIKELHNLMEKSSNIEEIQKLKKMIEKVEKRYEEKVNRKNILESELKNA